MTSERHADVKMMIPSYAPGAGALLPPRAHLADDPGVISLDGTWAFAFYPTDPEPFVNVEEPWAEPAGQTETRDIDVPSHWVLRGEGAYGRPAYTNVDFPFPVDPPFPPGTNPVGDYRRTVELPADWQGGVVALRFDGVDSQATVWVNGTWVGMARGSRLAHEFDVTGAVRPGLNRITVRVHQFSAGSYLEDQDQWWLPGIFRSVSLRHLADGAIEDLWVDTDYEAGVGYASVEARVLGAQEDSLVGRLEIDGLGSCLLALERGEDGLYRSGRLAVGHVRPWSAREPALYDARVCVGGRAGLADAERTLCLGFRRVSCLREVQTISKRAHILPVPSLTRLTTGGVLNPLKNTTKIGHNELLHQEPLQPPLEPSPHPGAHPGPDRRPHPGSDPGSPAPASHRSVEVRLLRMVVLLL